MFNFERDILVETPLQSGEEKCSGTTEREKGPEGKMRAESGTGNHWLVGQRLDVKSIICPISVKPLSNLCPIG